MQATFRIRRDTAANWTAANPVLALGEPGVETDTRFVKYGDGSTPWTQLAYQGSGPKPQLIVTRKAASGSFQTLSSGFSVIAVNTVAVDNFSCFNTSTYLYTAKVAGLYLATATYRLVDSPPAGVGVAIGVDIGNVDVTGVHWDTTSAVSNAGKTFRYSISVSRMLSVAVGQQVRLYGFADVDGGIGVQSAELALAML